MSHPVRRVCPGFAVIATALLFAISFASPALASGGNEVVDEDTADFGFLEEIPAGNGFYSTGPGAPPLGLSSVHFTVDDTGREIFGTDRFNGSRFDAVLVEGHDAVMPARLWLGFGAHFHPGDQHLSVVDELRVWGRAG